MLVDEHQFVETDGESGGQRQADRQRADDHRRARDRGPPFSEAQPAEVLPRPSGHHDRDQTEQEGERDAVTGVEQADAGRAPRDLDRRGQRQQPREPE